MHVPINVKSPHNTSKWQMGFNSAFKGLMLWEVLEDHKKNESSSGFGQSSGDDGVDGDVKDQYFSSHVICGI
jgi:hypothetical protein